MSLTLSLLQVPFYLAKLGRLLLASLKSDVHPNTQPAELLIEMIDLVDDFLLNLFAAINLLGVNVDVPEVRLRSGRRET